MAETETEQQLQLQNSVESYRCKRDVTACRAFCCYHLFGLLMQHEVVQDCPPIITHEKKTLYTTYVTSMLQKLTE